MTCLGRSLVVEDWASGLSDGGPIRWTLSTLFGVVKFKASGSSFSQTLDHKLECSQEGPQCEAYFFVIYFQDHPLYRVAIQFPLMLFGKIVESLLGRPPRRQSFVLPLLIDRPVMWSLIAIVLKQTRWWMKGSQWYPETTSWQLQVEIGDCVWFLFSVCDRF